MNLVIHYGIPKTGSSYIQSRLFQIKDYLASRNIFLPVAKQQILGGAGNAAWLPVAVERCLALNETDLGEVILDTISSGIEAGLSGTNDGSLVVLSSENISSLSANGLDLLAKALHSRFGIVKWVGLTRVLDTFLASSYAQAVKSQGYFKSFEAYLAEHSETLMHVHRATERVGLICQEYPNFCHLCNEYESIDLDSLVSQIIDLEVPRQPLGRSIISNVRSSDALIAYMRFFNSVHFSYEIPDTCEQYILRHMSSTLAQEMQECLGIIVDPSPGCSTDDKSLIQFLFANLLKLSCGDLVRRREILEEAASIFSGYVSSGFDKDSAAICPKDFNPFIYLLMNEDVMLARVDPFWHYVNFGMDEGRLYKPSI